MPKRHKILITGASGMLGRDLSQELSSEFELWGLDIVTSNQKPEARKKLIICDIYDRNETIKAVSTVKPDIVVHTAAWTDVDRCELDKKKAYRVNSKGTENIALACKACDAALIYISTDFVFDGRKKRPYREVDKTNPLSVYASSKLEGERAVRKALKKYFILRTSWLYGRHGKNFVDTVLTKAKTEKILKVVGDQIGSPTYTKDLAKAIHALVNTIVTSNQKPVTRKNIYGIYHVSNYGSVSWYRYAKEILRLARSKTRVLPISSTGLNRPAMRPAMSILDNGKFIKFTHFKTRHWREALKDYLLRGAIC